MGGELLIGDASHTARHIVTAIAVTLLLGGIIDYWWQVLISLIVVAGPHRWPDDLQQPASALVLTEFRRVSKAEAPGEALPEERSAALAVGPSAPSTAVDGSTGARSRGLPRFRYWL